MANSGVGNKFVSVNLNKSYGQPQQQYHHNNYQHYGSGRNRPGGGGGGMVVLSRPRSSQKAAGTKLSVPHPLNLPSLRKEHERFDSSGSGGGPTGGASGVGGARPSSSGVGWTKPAVLGEKDGFIGVGSDHTGDNSSTNVNHGFDQGGNSVVNGVSKASSGSLYVPPSVRSVGPAASDPSPSYQVPEKATVLRGEDFPSLQAALPVVSVAEKKQKDGFAQKQKQVLNENLGYEQEGRSGLSALEDMHPGLQSSTCVTNGENEKVGEKRGLGGAGMFQKDRRQEEYFPEPLPLVKLNLRSDWADDERDTGHGLMDRGRDHGFTRNEAYWDRDFDFPRPSVLPQKPTYNNYDRGGQRDNETGNITSSEVTKLDTFGRDTRTSSREGREGNSWRVSSHLVMDGFGIQEGGNGRSGVGARPSNQNRKMNNENKYIPSPFRDNVQRDNERRDVGYGHVGRQPHCNSMDSFGGRASERSSREKYGNEHYNNNRSDHFQTSSASKSSFSLGSKGLTVNDPILSFGREKRPSSRNEKAFFNDPFIRDFGATGFDGHDPFDGAFVSLVKKKKDVLKQTDFHDPVRESFEAELERVQKMQEQERQRIIAEQERAVELARREEDERIRLAREQEERQRRLEDEAREAAWRAEQEKLEVMRKAEEQRIAREEEKRRIIMEEERRKQAAKQKLLELEERMAKRHAEATKAGSSNSSILTDEKMAVTATEKDVPKLADAGDWEDGERMVERITTSASTDSSGSNRPVEMGSRPLLFKDASSDFLDRGKHYSSWKRDALENGNSSSFLSQDQEHGHHSPQHDDFVGGRVFSRKEAYGGPAFMSSKTYHKGGIPESQMDDFRQIKGQRWDLSGDGDHFSRNLEFESEFHETLAERFGDGGWGQSGSRGNLYNPYHEHVYHNSEADGLYSFGRSRHSTRQPRVLPPPSMNSMQRSSYRGGQHPGPSIFPGNGLQYNDGTRSKSPVQTMFASSHQEIIATPQIADLNEKSTENVAQKMDSDTKRCDSQSSLSVSSPPDSPVHLSHDDLDDSGDFPGSAGDQKDETLTLQVNEPASLPIDSGKEKMMKELSCDDEEWPIENDDPLQEQEEYDEDEDGYGEEDEVHDGEEENTNVAQELEDLQLEEKGSPDMMDNLVLGFNEGVELMIPSDDFERNLRNEDAKFVTPQVSAGNVKELGSFDGICSEEQTLQHVTDSAELCVNDSSRIFQESEKKMQDLVIQPKHAPQTSAASEHMNRMDTSSGGLSFQAQVPSPTGQVFMSNAPSVYGQSEGPVKLQFGLFSGPSLIPSPVPAIQIGSIQMPLHLHPPVGPSGTQMHPSQPLVQFGQLRYTSPISQGVLPLAPQSMCSVEPTLPANFSLNRNARGPPPIQSAQETSPNLIKSDLLSVSTDGQPGPLQQQLDILSHGKVSKDGKLLPSRETSNAILKVEYGQGDLSRNGDGILMGASGFQTDESFMKNVKRLPTKESGDQPQTGTSLLQIASKDKDSSLVKGQGTVTGGRHKKYVVKNSGPKASLQPAEASQQDPGAFQRRPRRQRTEFRVRENAEKRQSDGSISSSLYGDDKSNTNGDVIGARNGSKRVIGSNRRPKQKFESDGLNSRLVAWEADSGGRAEKGAVKQSLRKNISQSGEDVDTSLQSGIVRVFEQPGIEAPSDDDDFIEVRSKRQMLNDRREQREKEIKVKSRVAKTMRKPRSASQTAAGNISSGKISASIGGGSSSNTHTDFVSTEGHGLGNIEAPVGFNTPLVSQPLPPIGTPAVKTDVQADQRSQTIKSIETSSLPVLLGGGNSLSPGLMFENQVLDNIQTSLGSWANSQINQQVMSLTQTQLNEAMKPGQLDSHSSMGDPAVSVGEPSLTSSSIHPKDKSFPSASTTINSLLAGDKIQFGAVTSPTIVPPSSRAISHGIGSLGASRPDIQMAHKLSAADNQCPLFFEKDKHSNESSIHLEDCEAEAEAAASAVAVAAISSDDIVANGLGTGPASSDSKSFGGADITGVSGDQHLASRSRAEESLSVALPADLSVETPPMSLWPPLPSPQHSSSQMLSHVPGGPPSHFPFYEMNPMLGGPIFAFGPHDERSSTQSQSHQKSNTPVSGPHGTWQHHSGVDSFYGHPAGFTGPFISPPGSIPGVQGPSHMVVYNHFAPVGQFGQVGLSFMGTTYIPSGKQPDWKHNPASAAMGAGEGEINNLDIVSAQRNPTSVSAPIQHLAPGSPLLPLASPLAMFDVPPFQSAPDMSVHACWPHVPASPLQSVSVSMPSQQQSEGVLPTQLNHGLSVDQSLAANRFPESQMPRPSDSGQNFPGATDATVNQLPDELGLVDSSRSRGTGTLAQSRVPKSSSAITIPDAGKTDGTQNCTSNSISQNTSSAFKTQPSHQKPASGQLCNSSSYNYQRGGSVPQKNSSGGEWSHRRMGYQGRNHSLGGEKNNSPSKMKQIYVAKQTTGATSTAL